MEGQDSTRRSRRRGPAGFLLVAVLGILAITRLTAGGRIGHDPGNLGPLDAGDRGATRSLSSLEIGQAVTVGGIVVSNAGSKPLVLEGLRLVPPPAEGLELIGAQVAPDEDRAMAVPGTSRRYPPDPADVGGAHPLPGAVIGPRTPGQESPRGTAILVGLRLTKPGVFGFEGLEIDYRVGGTRYALKVDFDFTACGPPADYPQECRAR
ncbi:MAG: hypothetical protein ACRDYV_23055 [Acidimicrobiia bacterium]